MATVSKLYTKSISFFSRTKQEDIVADLEKRFYSIILNTNEANSIILSLKLEAFENDLRNTILNYYFEDDLLEHLLNLCNFITTYSLKQQKIRMPVPEVNAAANIFRSSRAH